MKNYKAIIFDRDGTLNATSKGEGGYILSADELELLPYVRESLEFLKDNNISLYVFTQQRCIGKGLLTHKKLEEIHQKLNGILGEKARIDAFYYCPHLLSDGCACSKPKAGMLEQCIEEQGLSREHILVVGDSLRDYESAKAAGLDFAFVPNDLGKVSAAEYAQTGAPFYNNLQELVQCYFIKKS